MSARRPCAEREARVSLTAMSPSAMSLTGTTEPNLAERGPARREPTGRGQAGPGRPTPERPGRARPPLRNVQVIGNRSAGPAPVPRRAVTARADHRGVSVRSTDPPEPRGDRK